MAKILLVDDDDSLLAIVSESLAKEGHSVERCYSKGEATELLAGSFFDVIVLDVGLPDGSGFDICSDYRSAGGRSPILMLTGKSEVRDKEQGLDLGADDYLTKPFNLRELSARLRALLRRPPAVARQLVEIGAITIDATERRIFKNGVEIHLQPLDYSLLEYFIKHPHEALSQETILRSVWKSYTESGIEALRASVKRIRKEIDLPGQDSLIETVHKVGYCFRPTV
ncbi:MAG: response regulator transcription factor [Cyanobacteria bacterium REEB67]|nr:response regulator transcription factor [Cyanobacteria bacterium REEB67]